MNVTLPSDSSLVYRRPFCYFGKGTGVAARDCQEPTARFARLLLLFIRKSKTKKRRRKEERKHERKKENI